MYSIFLNEIDDKQTFSGQTDTPMPLWQLIESYNSYNKKKGSSQKTIILPVSGSRLKQAVVNLPADIRRQLMEQYEIDVAHARRQKYLNEKNAEKAQVKERLFPDYDKTMKQFDLAVGGIALILLLLILYFANDSNVNWYLKILN